MSVSKDNYRVKKKLKAKKAEGKLFKKFYLN